MKRHISLIILLTISYLGFSQSTSKGTVSGKVITSDGQPAAMVSVALKGTTKGSATNTQGEFEIRNVEPGSHTLVTSFIGLQTKEQVIEVKAGETTLVPAITLSENAQQLGEIVVIDSRENPFDRKQSDYVAKLPLKNMENPQVYNTISAELLKDQVVTNFDDALKNAPGVEKLWESTGRGTDGAGYFSLRGFESQPTMVNGLPGLTNGSLDPANIERIEVIKGPSGTLFGSSLVSYGGLINTVTKKPYETFGGEVNYITGNFGLHRITADVNAPLSGKISARLNTAYHKEKSFQDAGFRESFFIAPSISYKVSDRLSFLVNAEFLTSEGTNPTMLFLDRSNELQFSDLDDLNYDPELSLTNNGVTIKNPRYNLQAQGMYKLSDQWTSQTVVTRGSARSDGYYSYLWDNNAAGSRDFGLVITNQDAETVTTDIQQNFIGDFQIGNLRNRIVVGLDYFNRKVDNNDTGYFLFHNVTAQGEVNYDNVATPQPLTKAGIDAFFEGAERTKSASKDETYSIYFSDVINLTSQLSVMASLRFDYFNTEGDLSTEEDNYDQAAWSPKFGIVYQPILDKLSIFGNYMNGFKNVAPITTGNVEAGQGKIQTFEAEHANQLEFGIKTNLLAGKLSSTLSYYDIRVENRVMPGLGLNSFTQGGEVESQGFEISVNAIPVAGLNIIGGYSFNESEVVKGEGSSSFAEEGKRPAEAGPKNIFNAWAVYTISHGTLKGLGVGFGLNGASERMIMNSKATGQFTVPAYTVFNSSLFYNHDVFRITLKIDNLTDKEYYKGWTTINPQRPRSISASFTYRF